MYLYYPDANKVTTLNQSMLRQSFMEYDISFQDIAGDRELSDLYDASLDGEEEKRGVDSYVISLNGKEPRTLAYSYQKMW